MDENNITKFLADNSLFGATSALIMTILYKVYQILKKDRKEDDLDNAERKFRDELKEEVTKIKEENKAMREENNKLHCELAELNASLKFCNASRPNDCPLIQFKRNRNG